MAITAMGLGTKAAPNGANLDPQTQFWSFLSAFCGKQVLATTGSDNWTSRALFSGFRPRANDTTDMSVLIGGENGTIDSAVLMVAGSPVLLSTDGEAQKVTIPTAPSAGARYDAIVSYIDKTSTDPATEKPGTPDYVKTIVVSGTAASSPSKPTNSQIKAKLPAGVSNYFRWCNVYVESGATNINDANIEDGRPASPNVYYAPRVARWTGDFGYGKSCYLTRIGNVVLCQTFGGGVGKSTLGQWTNTYIECPSGFRPFGQEGRIVGVLPGGGATVFVQTVPFGEATMQQLVSGDWNSSNDYQGNGAWFTNDPFPTDSAINL